MADVGNGASPKSGHLTLFALRVAPAGRQPMGTCVSLAFAQLLGGAKPGLSSLILRTANAPQSRPPNPGVALRGNVATAQGVGSAVRTHHNPLWSAQRTLPLASQGWGYETKRIAPSHPHRSKVSYGMGRAMPALACLMPR